MKNAPAILAGIGARDEGEMNVLLEAKSTMDDTAGHSPTRPEPYGFEDLLSLKVTTGAVSPDMARHMRGAWHFERQRPISDRHVARLAEEMRRGWFLAGTAVFICVLPDGREQIVNGNHTLEAVAASGVSIPLTFIRRNVASMEDVARHYAAFDIGKVRTWRDTMLAAGAGENLPMPNEVLSAVGHIMSGFEYNPNNAQARFSRPARLATMLEYEPAAHLISDVIAEAPNSNRRIVKRVAFLAVALFTAKYQPAMAAEFWGGLAKDDGLKRDDPRKALQRYAVNNPGRGSFHRGVQSRAAALAWNAFFSGRSLEYCKPNAAQETLILGTPWHKGAPK
jgi:hypothetical protein